MADEQFLTDRTELTDLIADTYLFHLVDGSTSKKFELSNWIASAADIAAHLNNLKYITPLAITGFIPDKKGAISVLASSTDTFLTVATGLVISWNATNDQPVLTNTTGSNVTLTYDVTWVISMAKGSIQGTILTLATATTAYFSNQSIAVDAANAMVTDGDTCRLDSLTITSGTNKYEINGNFQLEASRVFGNLKSDTASTV